MDSDGPSFLLVDGNNILHAWEDLRTIATRNRRRAVVDLIRRLTDWSDDAEEKVVLVFDGGGALPREEQRDRRIQVIQGGGSETADVLIERLASKYAGIYRLAVATDDRAVQNLAAAAGAEVISSEGLKDRLDAGARRRAEWLRRHRKG